MKSKKKIDKSVDCFNCCISCQAEVSCKGKKIKDRRRVFLLSCMHVEGIGKFYLGEPVVEEGLKPVFFLMQDFAC